MPQPQSNQDDEYGLQPAKAATGVLDETYGLEPATAKKAPPVHTVKSGPLTQEQVDKFSPPTEFEKGINKEGLTPLGTAKAAWESIKSLPGGIASMLDPTRGLSGAALSAVHLNPRSGTAGEHLGEVPAMQAGHEMAAAYHDPNTKWWEIPLSGIGTFAGASAERAREHAAHGESNEILGEAAVPAAVAIGGAALPHEIIPKMGETGVRALRNAGTATKEGIATLARTPEGNVRPVIRAIGRVGGGLGGHAVAGPVGGIVGFHAAPDVMESVIPNRTPEPVYPGAPLPAAEDFYAHEGAERNLMRNREERATVAAARVAQREGKPVPIKESPYWNPEAYKAGEEQRISEMGGSPAQTPETPLIEPASSKAQVLKLPVPREPLPGENPGYMASIPRDRLLNLGRQARPGAGEQLRNIGRNVIYVPDEYPGPRPNIDEPQGPVEATVPIPQGALPQMSKVSAGNLKIGDTFIDETGDARRVEGVDEQGRIKTMDGTPKTYEGEITVGRGDVNSPESQGKISARNKGVEGGSPAKNFSQPSQVKMSPSEWAKLSDGRRMSEWRKALREQGMPEEQLPTMEEPWIKKEGTKEEPRFVYRVRDVGNPELNMETHAHATENPEEAEIYKEGRESVQEKPQEIMRVDLSKLKPSDYREMKGPRGSSWIRFLRQLEPHEYQALP